MCHDWWLAKTPKAVAVAAVCAVVAAVVKARSWGKMKAPKASAASEGWQNIAKPRLICSAAGRVGWQPTWAPALGIAVGAVAVAAS